MVPDVREKLHTFQLETLFVLNAEAIRTGMVEMTEEKFEVEFEAANEKNHKNAWHLKIKPYICGKFHY